MRKKSRQVDGSMRTVILSGNISSVCAVPPAKRIIALLSIWFAGRLPSMINYPDLVENDETIEWYIPKITTRSQWISNYRSYVGQMDCRQGKKQYVALFPRGKSAFKAGSVR